jgi:hypothetical protein
MIGEPGDCHWPKKQNDDDDKPKHKPPIEIFKPKHEIDIIKPKHNGGDGPIIQKHGPGNGAGTNFNPGMFKKSN